MKQWPPGSKVKILGNAEIYGHAMVEGNAAVYGDARVYGEARIYGSPKVLGKGRVYGDAHVRGEAAVLGEAEVGGSAVLEGRARVWEKARVLERANVGGFSEIHGGAEVSGNAVVFNGRVGGDAVVHGAAEVKGYADFAEVAGSAEVDYSAKVLDKAKVFDKAKVTDKAVVTDSAQVMGDAIVGGVAHVGGNAVIKTGHITRGTHLGDTSDEALSVLEEIAPEEVEEMTGEQAVGEWIQRGLRSPQQPSPETERFIGGEQPDIFAGMRQHMQSEVHKKWDNPRSGAKSLIDHCRRLWDAYYERPLKKNLVAMDRHLSVMKESRSVRVRSERARALRAVNKEWKLRGWKRPKAKKSAKKKAPKKKAKRRENPYATSPKTGEQVWFEESEVRRYPSRQFREGEITRQGFQRRYPARIGKKTLSPVPAKTTGGSIEGLSAAFPGPDPGESMPEYRARQVEYWDASSAVHAFQRAWRRYIDQKTPERFAEVRETFTVLEAQSHPDAIAYADEYRTSVERESEAQ
jgi:carbonic anhydrase/acetyltransferase-like protein (isoleucine patch superfamily)